MALPVGSPLPHFPDLGLHFSFPSVHQGAGGERPVPDAGKARRLRVARDTGDGHLQSSQPAAPMHHVCELCPEVSV